MIDNHPTAYKLSEEEIKACSYDCNIAFAYGFAVGDAIPYLDKLREVCDRHAAMINGCKYSKADLKQSQLDLECVAMMVAGYLFNPTKQQYYKHD